MSVDPANSGFRFEKRRADAVVRLTGGEAVKGCFFVAGSASHDGSERVAELLNSETGFFPFEIEVNGAPRTVLYNRAHLVLAQVFDDEARRDAGYAVAPRREVSLLLSTGDRIAGAIRVYQPADHTRLSDWGRQRETFRYLETEGATLIVNTAHIVAVTEVSGS
jgi:hypothetical protein